MTFSDSNILQAVYLISRWWSILDPSPVFNRRLERRITLSWLQQRNWLQCCKLLSWLFCINIRLYCKFFNQILSTQSIRALIGLGICICIIIFWGYTKMLLSVSKCGSYLGKVLAIWRGRGDKSEKFSIYLGKNAKIVIFENFLGDRPRSSPPTAELRCGSWIVSKWSKSVLFTK